MKTRQGTELEYKNPDTPNEYYNNQDKTISTGVSTTKNWTFLENQAYVEFLSDNEKMMKDSTMRRSNKIFLEMSLFIRTKFPEQCRTHHQKVLNKYGTNEKIINCYLKDQAQKKKSQTQIVQYEEKVKMGNMQIWQEEKKLNFIVKILIDDIKEA